MSKCIEKDCNTYSIYNFENETKKLYCAKHLIIGIIK
jgi:hypothetical protein